MTDTQQHRYERNVDPRIGRVNVCVFCSQDFRHPNHIGHNEDTPQNLFWRAFIDATEAHPFNNTVHVWNGRVVLEVHIWWGKVRLSLIQSLFPGQGDASRCLDWFIDLARQHGLEITGSIQRLGKQGLTHNQLRQWYKRHGAKVDRSGTFVIS